MESPPQSAPPTQPRRKRLIEAGKNRPFLLVLGLFGIAVIIGCIVIGIWLSTKSSSTDGPTTTTASSPTTTTTTNGSIPTTTIPTTPSKPTPVPKMNMVAHLQIFNTTIVHGWLKAKHKDRAGILFANFSSSNSQKQIFSTRETEWYDFFTLELNESIVLEFSWSNSDTDLSYLYAFEPENVKTDGIRPAFISEETIEYAGMTNSFHLRPPLGWQNDPNGFSRANDGLYHLFYQHYPHNRKWHAMHWGHAISRDLVNWAHQPIFFRPDDKECGDGCGWFSGSAMPLGNHGLRIFVTDHNSSREVSWEMQAGVDTVDGIRPAKEHPTAIIERQPEQPRADIKLTHDFRDPNVFLGPNGYYYMTLGSKDALGKGGVILLYRTKEAKLDSEWTFQQVLLTDNTFGTEVCECSAMFPLGDPSSGLTYYALMYARMTSLDGDGRQNLSPIILGTFDGTRFSRIAEQELDFAAGSYGFQAFYDPIGRETLLIGWLANWPDFDRRFDFASSMTLPRVLKRSGNTILMGPHPNVLNQLKGEQMDGKALLRGNTVFLPNGTAYVQFGLNYNYFYNGVFLRLNHPDYLQLGVRITYIGMEIVKVKIGDKPNRRYMATNAQPDIVHIYIDRDSMEVFGEKRSDGGMPRWTGTTRLTGAEKGEWVQSIQMETSDRYNYVMNSCEIWSMKPAKLAGRMLKY